MSEVFLSYRRKDNPHAVGRLFDALTSQFGNERVFQDVPSNPYGSDYASNIESAINKCRIMLVIIGHEWLGIDSENGARRIDEPKDYVRFEVSTALQLGKEVIPVIIDDAPLPHSEILPCNLKPLPRRTACPLRYDPDFWKDFNALCNRLRALGFTEHRKLDTEAYEKIAKHFPTDNAWSWLPSSTLPTIVNLEDMYGPNYDGLEFIQQSMIVDLRHWRAVPSEHKANQRYSPVTWTRYLRFKRKPQNPQKQITFRFRNRGSELDFRCRQPERKHTARKGAKRIDFVGSKNTAWEFTIDIEDFKIDSESELVTDAILWNGHQNTSPYAACFIDARIALFDMWLLFSNGCTPRDISLDRVHQGTNDHQKLPILQEHFESNDNNSILHWHQDRPLVGYSYHISWHWREGVVVD